MILILSERFDNTTSEICKWLHYFGDNFVRINKEDVISDFYLNITEELYFVFSVNDILIDSRKISFYYYRRGDYNFGKNTKFDLLSNEKKNISNTI